jgi:hypothetical protein
MREHEAYRDNYASLLEYFGRDRQLLSIKDVAKYCGRDPRTVAKLYSIPKHGITMPTLARKMCH